MPSGNTHSADEQGKMKNNRSENDQEEILGIQFLSYRKTSTFQNHEVT